MSQKKTERHSAFLRVDKAATLKHFVSHKVAEIGQNNSVTKYGKRVATKDVPDSDNYME